MNIDLKTAPDLVTIENERERLELEWVYALVRLYRFECVVEMLSFLIPCSALLLLVFSMSSGWIDTYMAIAISLSTALAAYSSFSITRSSYKLFYDDSFNPHLRDDFIEFLYSKGRSHYLILFFAALGINSISCLSFYNLGLTVVCVITVCVVTFVVAVSTILFFHARHRRKSVEESLLQARGNLADASAESSHEIQECITDPVIANYRDSVIAQGRKFIVAEVNAIRSRYNNSDKPVAEHEKAQ